MVVTYSPAGKDLYIYFTDIDPGEAARSLSNIPVRMLIDGDHQWIGFEIIEALPDGSLLDLVPALAHARENAPEMQIGHDAKRRVTSMRWAPEEPASILPWEAILDFDAAGDLIGVEFLFGGALEIEGRLSRLPHHTV